MTRARLLAFCAGAGVLALATAAPAVAGSASVTVSPGGSPYGAEQTVRITGTDSYGALQPPSTVKLTLADPLGHSVATQSAAVPTAVLPGTTTVTISWDLRCGTVAPPCAAAQPNGTYVATLSGDASGTGSFAVALPPLAPTGVSATGGTGEITVHWNRPSEPDIAGYDVLVDGAVATSGACCSATVAAAAGSHSVIVRATRWTSPAHTARTAAVASSPATAVVAPGSPPPGTPAPGGGGGTTPAPGAPGSPAGPGAPGGALPGQPGAPAPVNPDAVALQFKAFLPLTNVPKLPPQPDVASPQVAGAPVDDTFAPQLSYGRTAVPGSPRPRVGDPVVRAASAVTGGNARSLGIPLAAALVLLLAAAHVRRWSRGDVATRR